MIAFKVDEYVRLQPIYYDGLHMNIESETARVQGFVDKGNYHAAINIALSAMNECRRINDQTGIDLFLDIINKISLTLIQAFGSKT